MRIHSNICLVAKAFICFEPCFVRQVQRIAEFEQQHESLLKQLPVAIQELVKSRQKDAATVEGASLLIYCTVPQFTLWSDSICDFN